MNSPSNSRHQHIPARSSTLSGYGAFLDVDADCERTQDFNADGTIDTLEHGSDSTSADFRSMFIYNSDAASDILIEGLTIDGGSNQYLYTQRAANDAAYCDANDTDGDAASPDNCPCDATDNTAPCTVSCASGNVNHLTLRKVKLCGAGGGRVCPFDDTTSSTRERTSMRAT